MRSKYRLTSLNYAGESSDGPRHAAGFQAVNDAGATPDPNKAATIMLSDPEVVATLRIGKLYEIEITEFVPA